jgi:hypothetical protein
MEEACALSIPMGHRSIITSFGLCLFAAFSVATAIEIGTIQARSDESGVTFTGEFSSPPTDPPTLVEGVPVAFHAQLKITNDGGHPLRFARYRSVVPQVLDAAGAVMPSEFGANVSRIPQVTDYPLLAPGQTLVISVDGTMTLRGTQIAWRGGDGTLGFWKISRASPSYEVRLIYRQTEKIAGPIGANAETLDNLWTGEGVTSAVILFVKFT